MADILDDIVVGDIGAFGIPSGEKIKTYLGFAGFLAITLFVVPQVFRTSKDLFGGK